MRPALLDPLFAPAATLPGVGPKYAKLIDKLLDRPQGARVVDVLFHLPHAIVARGKAADDGAFAARYVAVGVDGVVPPM